MRLRALRLYDLSDFAVILPCSPMTISRRWKELRPYAVKHNNGDPRRFALLGFGRRLAAFAHQAQQRRQRQYRDRQHQQRLRDAAAHRMPNSPLLIDGARRRFCSSISQHEAQNQRRHREVHFAQDVAEHAQSDHQQ